ncbi:phage tail sheath C-terminal domain-containing protein [Shewanella surugensis]|uniref:Phage tail sheath subtilisin-like domain-containing protein n=1 Tax=Shewanella surugensis TaxID=212020 RepID=A0ABT0L9Y1_9GAMM|nr:phage tail sheath C-terminal domain-containing protein [Shewanella surugensis]MCL1124165.1 phage tail sheath subtilisin-like domain-containing protein [Shewanella surugensis]
MTQFLHGVEIIEIDNSSRPIQTVKSAVIGLVGTAPDAALATQATLALGSAILNDGLAFQAVTAGRAGNGISVELIDPETADNVLGVVVDGHKIKVVLATDATSVITSTAVDVKAAIEASSAAIALITTTVLGDGSEVVAPTNVTYLANGTDEAFPINTPVVIAGSRKSAEALGTSGTLPAAIDDIFDQTGALVIVIRAEVGATDAETQSNVVSAIEGVIASQNETGYTPRILVAPEFSEYDSVASELEMKAKRLKAIAYVDCSRVSTYTDAIKRTRQFSERVEITWPWVRVFDDEGALEIDRPYSARAAGLRARVDAEKGFWESKSNKQVYGIIGLSQSVDWQHGNAECVANILNENKVSTIIREGGFRHWGNRTCSVDPKWKFEQTRRTADIINDSLQREHLWAVDKSTNNAYITNVTDGVNAYLRSLKKLGAIINGKCWADEELNTPESLQNGVVFFNFDFCPPYPAEHIIFNSSINNDYLQEVFA